MLEIVKVPMEWDGTFPENEPEGKVIAVCWAIFALLDVRQGAALEPIVVSTENVTGTALLPLGHLAAVTAFPRMQTSLRRLKIGMKLHDSI